MEQPKQSSRKQRQKDAQKSQHGCNNNNNGTERLKTVVRRLPHNLPEEVFWQSVQAWVTEETATWKMFCPGKLKKRINKESVPSRAYIAFKNEEVLATFSREYDGHTFRDKSGNESHAVVEFAPFQKVPVEKRKPDSRINTIDKDEDYISFLESLKKSDKSESVPLETLAAQPAPPPTTTPLLEALKAEKLAQKDKEIILRSHAHYKESATAAKKEETKKKAATVVQAQATAAAQKSANEGGGASQPMSKKSKKAAIAAQKAAAQETQPPVRIAVKPSPPVVTAAAPNVAPAPPTAPRSQRERPPKGHKTTAATAAHVRQTEAVSSAPPAAAPAPEGGAPGTPSLTPTTTPIRRGRPVIGIGRHFETALNGVVGGGGDRKRRGEKEKEKEAGSVSSTAGGGTAEGKTSTIGSVAGPSSSAGSGTGASKRKDHHPSGGKQKEDKTTTGGGTGGTSILQRSEASDLVGEVAIMQRPDIQTSPQADAPSGRGGGGRKRGGRGRGRGAHRGG
ncbi:Smg-4/UPF3 family-domain-containing protein [Pisolithus croceorrhizus]|nr:Smg-4/UPF3 family-domain-containing protein [Pisolithus croceorrhizus]